MEGAPKAGIVFTKQYILGNILSFLSPSELSIVRIVCKAWNEASENCNLILQLFFSFLKIEMNCIAYKYFIDLSKAEKKVHIKRCLMECSRGAKWLLPVVAYEFNGLTKQAITDSYVNLFTKNTVKFSLIGDNSYIQSVCSNTIQKYIQSEGMNNIKELGPVGTQKVIFPIDEEIHKIRESFDQKLYVPEHLIVYKVHSQYANPVKALIVFVSMTCIHQDEPIVKYFDNCDTEIMFNSLGFESYETRRVDIYHEFILNCRRLEDIMRMKRPEPSRQPVYPLIIGFMDKTPIGIYRLEIKQRIGFRFCMIKYISSHGAHNQNPIECYNLVLRGTFLNFAHPIIPNFEYEDLATPLILEGSARQVGANWHCQISEANTERCQGGDRIQLGCKHILCTGCLSR